MKYFNSYKEYNIVNEGGIYGNILHPYNDINLSFEDVKNIIKNTLTNSDYYGPISEKFDGLAVAVTYKNNNVFVARNKTHLKNSANNAISAYDFKNMYDKQGYKGFVKITQVIENLFKKINKINPNFLNEIFNEGESFLTIEGISNDFVNVIKYDRNYCIFHEILTYDITGNVINRSTDLFENLLSFINNNELNNIDTYLVRGPHNPKIYDKDYAMDKYVAMVDNIMNVNFLDNENKIINYKEDLRKVFVSLGKYVVNNMDVLSNDQDNEVPSEGIVFNYNNTLYKLTGDFHEHMMKNLKNR